MSIQGDVGSCLFFIRRNEMVCESTNGIVYCILLLLLDDYVRDVSNMRKTFSSFVTFNQFGERIVDWFQLKI